MNNKPTINPLVIQSCIVWNQNPVTGNLIWKDDTNYDAPTSFCEDKDGRKLPKVWVLGFGDLTLVIHLINYQSWMYKFMWKQQIACGYTQVPPHIIMADKVAHYAISQTKLRIDEMYLSVKDAYATVDLESVYDNTTP